jgi:hypothetical protein
MASMNDVERARREGVLLGIPLGDLGWFQSLLMGLAAGFAAFFAATFLSIVGYLFYAAVTGRPVGELHIERTYKLIGFPVGVVVMALALSYLGVQWSRRMVRKSRRA